MGGIKLAIEPGFTEHLRIRIVPWVLLAVWGGLTVLFAWGMVDNGIDNGLWLIMLLVMLAGLIFFCEIDTCDLDAPQRKIQVSQQRIWRRRHWEFTFDDLQNVSVESNHNQTNSTTYRLVFRLKSAEAVPLTSYSTSGKGSKNSPG